MCWWFVGVVVVIRRAHLTWSKEINALAGLYTIVIATKLLSMVLITTLRTR